MSTTHFRRAGLLLICLVLLLSVLGIAPHRSLAQAPSSGVVIAWEKVQGAIYPSGRSNVPAELKDVVAIAAGSFHSLALKSDGTVVSWGCTIINTGQCNVPAGLSGVVAISAAANHSMALKSDGTLLVWGGYEINQPPSGLSDVVAIDAGPRYAMALKADGTVVTWGRFSFPQPPDDLDDVVAISAGSHALALKSDGSLVAFGCVDPELDRCVVPPDLADVTAIVAAGSYDMALKSDGSLVMWGCPVGTPSKPAGCPALPPDLAPVRAIDENLAITADGGVVAWGCSEKVGPNCGMPPGLHNAIAIASGPYHNLVLIPFEDGLKSYTVGKFLAVEFIRYDLPGGVAMLANDYPTTVAVSCLTGDPLPGAPEETVNRVTSRLWITGEKGIHQWVMQIQPEWAGTCRRLTLDLISGKDIVRYFRVE